MSRRLGLVFVLVMLSTACSGTGGTEPDAPSPNAAVSGEVSFMAFGDPEELQAYRSLIEAFKKVEPDISVSFIETSDREDLLARLSTGFSAGTPPDLFLMNYRFYGQFAAKGVLQPLQERLNASRVFQQEDFYPQAMEAFQVDDEQVCMPQNISSLVVYYNKDLFREAGVEPPSDGWTWDEMVASAQALTEDLDDDGVVDRYGLGVEPSIIRIAPFVWSNGGEIVDDEENPTRFALDTPKAVAAMQDFFDLRQAYRVVPNEEEIESEDNETRFMNGTMAMVLGSRRNTPAFRTITDFDWDVAALPRHKEHAGILHSDAYCMSAASKNKEAAWRFVEFAVGPEGAPITAASGRTVPSLIEVAESESFLDPNAKPANSRVFLDTISVIRRVPNISTWPEIEDASEGILEEGLYEGVPADEVARQLREQTEGIFARAE